MKKILNEIVVVVVEFSTLLRFQSLDELILLSCEKENKTCHECVISVNIFAIPYVRLLHYKCVALYIKILTIECFAID